MRMPRGVVSLCVFLLVASALVGCGKGKKQDAGQVDGYIYIPSARTADSPVTLSVWPEPIASTASEGRGLMPLPGAQVKIMGTDIRAVSDENGYFILPRVPKGKQALMISYGELEPFIMIFDVPAGKLIHADSRALVAH